MPEGDTIHKLARVMQPRLVGKRLTQLYLRDRGSVKPCRGGLVEEVVALGKHLLIAVQGGWVVHVHLGMRGIWHYYPHDHVPTRSATDAVLRVDTATESLLCFSAKCVEVLRRVQLRLHPTLSRLGPDLLAQPFDASQLLARTRALGRPGTDIATLLLDQRVACGIGNVYKSETLFLEEVHPWIPTSALADSKLLALYRRARALMWRNLGGGRRDTVRAAKEGCLPGAGRYRSWVYQRAGEPCLRCGVPICGNSQGEDARPTFWCPNCQSPTVPMESERIASPG